MPVSKRACLRPGFLFDDEYGHKSNMNRKIIPVLLVFIFAATACAAPGNNSLLPQASPTALPVLIQPTATPDPNQLTISVEIVKEYSQEEIAKILYTAWLDHFVSENVSPEMRLDEYVINKINIPLNQRCAKELGGTFIAEAEVTAKPFLPLVSTASYERSDWGGGAGIISESASHITRLFDAVVSQLGNTYTLVVVTQVPMCD